MSSGLDDSLPSLNDVTWIFGIGLLLIIGLVFYLQYEESKLVYKMPNGIICELKIIHGGSIFEFRQCEDGEEYINPKYYKEIRK